MKRKDITSIYYDKCIYQFRDTRLDDPIIKWSVLVDPTNIYLTIEALEDDLTVSFSTNTIQYSIDKCQTWNELPANTATPAINAGNMISFKATRLVPNTMGEGIGTFTVNKKFNLKGNVMSMLFGDKGKDRYDLTGYDYAFCGLFYGCATLQSVSKNFLPATTLADRCYSSMFRGCTSLVTAPELPATTLAPYCYNEMFYDCTSLVTAPELPATTLTDGCYFSMFYGCSSLTTAPELPATALANSCYFCMFQGCESLATAPELPATTLTNNCYTSMFYGCTSLATAPELPATTLVDKCYGNMFYNCTSLNYIKALFTTTPGSSYTKNWVNKVSGTGVFVKNADATWNVTGVNGIPTGWTVKTMEDYYLTIEALEDDLTVSFIGDTIQYSTDNCQTWNELPADAATPAINSGNKISFKATGLKPNPEEGIGTFMVNKNFNLKGNVMSMLFGDEGCNNYDLTGHDWAFAALFGGCSTLQSVSKDFLPATILSTCCYKHMFIGCSSLVTAPELPATSLAMECYQNMFIGCSSLVTAPELPATTLVQGCYVNMFSGCTSLNYIKALFTTEPGSYYTSYWVDGVSPTGTFVKNADATWNVIGSNGVPTGWTAKTVEDCYLTIEALEDDLTVSFSGNTIQYSIDDCQTWSKLIAGTATPVINTGDKISFKATGLKPNSSNGIGWFTVNKKFNLKGNVMSMLFGDEGYNNYDLTGYYYAFGRLFNNCTTLQSVSKYFLPATTLADKCYQQIFYNCTSLTTAPELPATTLATNCYSYMFQNCSSLVTAPELSATTLAPYCYQYMFENCSSLIGVPSILPATTLTEQCYANMFSGCTSLTTAPELPATALAKRCYNNMFENCSSLVTAPELPAATLVEYCYSGMFSGCTSLTTAPALPVTTLADRCYSAMFFGCTSLVTAPELPATTLVGNCYQNMFYGCTSLNYIKALFTTEPGWSYTYGWVNRVSPTGTFIKNAAATWDVTGVDGIPEGWTVQTA